VHHKMKFVEISGLIIVSESINSGEFGGVVGEHAFVGGIDGNDRYWRLVTEGWSHFYENRDFYEDCEIKF